MKILTVSNSISVLSELNERLAKAYPQADIIGETDPLMAGKYSCNNDVDMLFAAANMKRMTGMQLIDFIKREHVNAATYLVGTDEEISETVTDAYECVTGVIVYPFTEKSFERSGEYEA